jgi:hypothetical protein
LMLTSIFSSSFGRTRDGRAYSARSERVMLPPAGRQAKAAIAASVSSRIQARSASSLNVQAALSSSSFGQRRTRRRNVGDGNGNGKP